MPSNLRLSSSSMGKQWPAEAEALPPALQQHYTVQQLAKLWGRDECTIRRMFQDEPGVLKVSMPKLVKRRSKRAPKVFLSIPASVAVRVHDRQSRTWLSEVQSRGGRVE